MSNVLMRFAPLLPTPLSRFTMRKSLFRVPKEPISHPKRAYFATQKSLFRKPKEPLLKIVLLVIIFPLLPFHALAADFLPSWITAPDAERGAQVWFRGDYSFSQKPLNAYLVVATTGRVCTYVNGWNVSTDILSPTRCDTVGGAVAVVHDVTRFLQRGRNTVAVWFAPLHGCVDGRQIAVALYGKGRDGEAFSYVSDGDWLCRHAPVKTDSAGVEYIDGCSSHTLWLDKEHDLALWKHAVEYRNQPDSPRNILYDIPEERRTAYKATRAARTLRPRHFDICGDSVVYDFGIGVRGQLRITLRGARRGEEISVGNIRYVCSGRADEQIIQRFSTTDVRRLTVCGDANFAREQIIDVEMITTEDYLRLSYK